MNQQTVSLVTNNRNEGIFMDAITMIKERRSIRKFKDQKVDREIMKEIVSISSWAPSWVNSQIARYTLIDDEQVIQKLATEGVNDFVYNIGTLKNAKGVAVLSYVQGKSGKLPKETYGETKSFDGYATTKANAWEAFDAGIACQTFCLAAHAKGIGTCILGVIDEKSIAQIINLPEDETIAALIVYGYEDGHPAPTPRKDVEEIIRLYDQK